MLCSITLKDLIWNTKFKHLFQICATYDLMKAYFSILVCWKKITIFWEEKPVFYKNWKRLMKEDCSENVYLASVSYNMFIKVIQLRLSGTWYIGAHGYRCVIRRSFARKADRYITFESLRSLPFVLFVQLWTKTHIKIDLCIYKYVCTDISNNPDKRRHCKFS